MDVTTYRSPRLLRKLAPERSDVTPWASTLGTLKMTVAAAAALLRASMSAVSSLGITVRLVCTPFTVAVRAVAPGESPWIRPAESTMATAGLESRAPKTKDNRLCGSSRGSLPAGLATVGAPALLHGATGTGRHTPCW